MDEQKGEKVNFFQTIAEGGQTWAHRVRMVRQVLKIALSLSLVVGGGFFAFKISKVPPILLKSSWYRAKAQVFDLIDKDVGVSQSYWESISHEKISAPTKKVSSIRLLHYATPLHNRFIMIAKKEAATSLSIALISLGALLTFFFIRGTTTQKRKHLSGNELATPNKLRLKLLLKNQASDLRVGKMPLLKNTETQHFIVTGGTGSGKTNFIHSILPQVRDRKNKAIIIDTTGMFLERYYDPAKDLILNPFKESGTPWNPWAECENLFDYESLAESFIPHTHHENENYWRTAARALFSSLLQKTEDSQLTSELSKWLLFEPLDSLAVFVQGTKAAAHIDPNSERTAASIRSVASSFLGCLEYLGNTQDPFSIKKWVARPDDNSWLFISCTPAQRSALNPLITTWISVAIRGLLELTPDRDRRLWFFLDELPTLNKIKDLESLIAEGRKYGGCGVLAIQSFSQMEEIYGRAAAKTITGNCSTKVVFSEQDPEVAARISKSLGEREVKECQEGISYGAHEVRDGVSLSMHTRRLPIVSATDIQSLERNHAYVKLPGQLPIAKIKLPIVGGKLSK